jgi:hypothetical protein
MTLDDDGLNYSRRGDALAQHLLQLYGNALVAQAEKVDIAPGVQAAAVQMDHAQLIAFVIEAISETWFYHPELLGPYAGEIIQDKVAMFGKTREDYDQMARPSTYIMAATLAGTLDMDNLPEELGRMGLGPHAVDS